MLIALIAETFPPKIGAGFTTSLSAPNVSLSKKIFDSRPSEQNTFLSETLEKLSTSIPRARQPHPSLQGNKARGFQWHRYRQTPASRATNPELVPLRMAAKVVKRVEDQDARARPRRLAIKTAPKPAR